jgi:hypothetical protein
MQLFHRGFKIAFAKINAHNNGAHGISFSLKTINPLIKTERVGLNLQQSRMIQLFSGWLDFLDVHRTGWNNGRNRVFIDHLGHCIAQKHNVLIE